MQDFQVLKINKRAGEIKGCIRFDKGSAMFVFPKEFIPCIDKVKRKMLNQYFRYADSGGELNLRKEIVKLEALKERKFSAEDIVITHGGMSGLFLIFQASTKPGDEVITNDYCFEGFSGLIKTFGLVHRRADYSDINSVAKVINKRTRILILNSPENPTGKIYTKEEIDGLLKITKQNNIILISDEVMDKIIYKGNSWFGPKVQANNVVIVNSFSKTAFIPGIRVGWVASRNKNIVETCRGLIDNQSVGVNLFGQILMAEVLQSGVYHKVIKEKLAILDKRRSFFEKLLREKNISFLQAPSGGMNFYVDLGKDTKKLADKLLKFGVAIIPGYAFEKNTKSNYARLGFGAVTEKEIKKGIEIICKFI